MRSDLDALLGAQRLAITYAALARTEPVLSEPAIERVHLVRSTAELSRQVSATSDESGLLMIRAVDSDPAVAADLANAVADATLVMQSTLWPLGSAPCRSMMTSPRCNPDRGARSKPEGDAGSQGPDDPRSPWGGGAPDPLASLTATYVDLLPMSSAGSPTTLSLLERAVSPLPRWRPGPSSTRSGRAPCPGARTADRGRTCPSRRAVPQPGRRLKQAR